MCEGAGLRMVQEDGRAGGAGVRVPGGAAGGADAGAGADSEAV